MLQGIVVSVGLSTAPDKSYEEHMETSSFQKFLHKNHTPTSITRQAILDATNHIRKHSINKETQDSIIVEIGGVVGDKHFFPIREIINGGEKFSLRRQAELCFFKLSEYHRLNQLFGTNVGPGNLGENITTDGIDIDSLPCDTVLDVGTAKIKILARRSFCYKFINTFLPDKEYWTTADRRKFDRTRVGVVGQVIQPGVIKPGDSIMAHLPDNTEPMPAFGPLEKFIRTKIVD